MDYARALVVEKILKLSRSATFAGTSPQRIIVSSLSPVSRSVRITGLKVEGAMLKSGGNSKPGGSLHSDHTSTDPRAISYAAIQSLRSAAPPRNLHTVEPFQGAQLLHRLGM